MPFRNLCKPEVFFRARRLRNSPTPAESRLWARIRKRQLCGFRFRRQAVIFGFIVDFYCPARKLVIELDGSSHNSRKSYDAMRDSKIATAGMKIIRFQNYEVHQSIEIVLATIVARLQNLDR